MACGGSARRRADILVQDRRNGAAAKRVFKHLLRGLQYKPRRLITDEVAQLRRRSTSKPARCPVCTSRYLNNRPEESHRPTRPGERQMQKFKSGSQAQQLLSAHAIIYGISGRGAISCRQTAIDELVPRRSKLGDRRLVSTNRRDTSPMPSIRRHASVRRLTGNAQSAPSPMVWLPGKRTRLAARDLRGL